MIRSTNKELNSTSLSAGALLFVVASRADAGGAGGAATTHPAKALASADAMNQIGRDMMVTIGEACGVCGGVLVYVPRMNRGMRSCYA